MKIQQISMKIREMGANLKSNGKDTLKENKKVVEGTIAGIFAVAMIATASLSGTEAPKVDEVVEQTTIETSVEENIVATKEKAETEVVAAMIEIPEVESIEVGPVTEVVVEPEVIVEPAAEPVAEEASEWSTRLMPNVEESLNIRTDASEEADLAGKLYIGSVAEVLEQGDEWTRISSGDVEGYVKNEFCVFGAEAEVMANKQCTTYATAVTGGVRVRETADSSEDDSIVYVLEEGEDIAVDTIAEAPEGWVAVSYNDTTAYVSSEFVTVEMKLGEAISIEEMMAAIRAEEQAAKSASSTVQREATNASYDDVTLLAALIQCEAGSECYEGQVAVGAVVMNRLRNGYAGSIYGVIYQSGQFSPASSGALSRALANGVSGSCLQAAQAAISGVDNVGGATNFRNASCGQSGIVIGNHVFW